jgi:hypothetical protein
MERHDLRESSLGRPLGGDDIEAGKLFCDKQKAGSAAAQNRFAQR